MRTVCHNTFWTEWSHFITRTRAAQECTSLCLKIVVIHVSCLVPCRNWHWPQAQVLSHLHHPSFRRSLPHTQILWRTIHIYPAKIHGRVADQHKSHLSQGRGAQRWFVCGNARHVFHQIFVGQGCELQGFRITRRWHQCCIYAHSNRWGNLCESAFRYQEFKIWATQGSSEWNEEIIKALERVLMRQNRDKYAFQQNDIIPCFYKRFCDKSDLEQHGDDFLVCGLTSNLELLADEFKNHFLVKKAEIVSLKTCATEWNSFSQTSHQCGWFWVAFWVGSKVCDKFVWCTGDESLQVDGHSWIERTGEQPRGDWKVGSAGISRVPIRCWHQSVYDSKTLRHCLQYEGNHERGSRTHHSLKDKIEENRALPQRTSAMCTEFPLGGKAGRRHPCDRGCRLVWRPKDKVLHVWRSVGNRSVLHSSTLVCDTGNSIAVLNRVRGQCHDKRLHGSVVRETLAGTPDCTTVQNLSLDGQQQRQSHHATAWTRAQRKTFGGAGDVGSTVEQDRSHLAEQVEYVGKCGRFAVNKLARAVTNWTKSCDKRLARLISCIHHTSEYRQYCYVGNTAQQCRLGLFQDFDFAGDLENSKSTSGRVLCIFGSQT